MALVFGTARLLTQLNTSTKAATYTTKGIILRLFNPNFLLIHSVRIGFRLQNADVRKIAVMLVKIQAVAHHELVGDGIANIFRL